jgi:GTPase
MLSRIGYQARIDMEKMLRSRVLLKLFVKVTKDWVSNQRMLNEFGY